jgi:hypothetical protein
MIIASTAIVLSIAAIAISGAALAWSIGWSVYTHRRATRPSLTVTASFAIPVYGAELGEQSISVTVANAGNVPTTLASVLFEIRGSKETLVPIEWLVQDPRPLPIVLAGGERWEAMVTLDGVTRSLRQRFGETSQRIRPVARDATSSYTADGWLTM